MKDPLGITVSKDQSRVRLDRYLVCQGVNFSRNRIQKLIESGAVKINGQIKPPGYTVKPGDRVTIAFGEKVCERPPLAAEDIPLSVVFEDDQLLVVDKPAGLVVHPAPGNYRGTLVNALMHHAQNLSQGRGGDRPGILHRLDKDTSGLLLVAKTDQAHWKLAAQLEARTITRRYWAVAWGLPPQEAGTINAPIGRSAFDRKKMGVTELRGREARTDFKTLKRFGIASLLELKLSTGRTHQIRVHLAHLGHPVVGDPSYGGRDRQNIQKFARKNPEEAQHLLELIPRQALHARVLGFVHPVSNEYMEFSSPLPADMAGLLEFLEQRFGGSL